VDARGKDSTARTISFGRGFPRGKAGHNLRRRCGKTRRRIEQQTELTWGVGFVFGGAGPATRPHPFSHSVTPVAAWAGLQGGGTPPDFQFGKKRQKRHIRATIPSLDPSIGSALLLASSGRFQLGASTRPPFLPRNRVKAAAAGGSMTEKKHSAPKAIARSLCGWKNRL